MIDEHAYSSNVSCRKKKKKKQKKKKKKKKKKKPAASQLPARVKRE